MAQDTASDQEHTAELMAQIEDRYLLLIRENYLDEPLREAFRDYIVDSLRKLMHAGRFSCVYDLACSRDWREAVVGLHYAIILASPAFDLARAGRTAPRAYQLLANQVADSFENELRGSDSFVHSLSTRPAFLLFAILNRRNAILEFLAADRSMEDATDIYAAALASETLTRSVDVPLVRELTALRERVIARLQAEPWFDEADFAKSEARFLQSWNYWTGKKSSG